VDLDPQSSGCSFFYSIVFISGNPLIFSELIISVFDCPSKEGFSMNQTGFWRVDERDIVEGDFEGRAMVGLAGGRRAPRGKVF
jgi:hypothetical protein